jgi:hypothetical protein
MGIKFDINITEYLSMSEDRAGQSSIGDNFFHPTENREDVTAPPRLNARRKRVA